MKNDERRDRLVELLSHLEYQYTQTHSIMTENVADYLLKHMTFAKWIPVSEPPTEADEYIVMIKGGANATALLYDPTEKIWFEEDAHGNVEWYAITHWMPMPEPPMKKKRIIGTAKLREKSGMSQKALGKIVGKSQQAVATWETGVSEPDIETMFALADVFGCTLEELFEEEIKNGNAEKTSNTD